MTKECKFCKGIFPFSMFGKNNMHKDGRENTCKSCRNIRRPKFVSVCEQCKLEFISAKKNGKFCGSECRGLHRRNRVIVRCDNCGRSKEVIKSLSNLSKNFCRQSCRTEYMKTSMVGASNPNYNRVKYNCDGCHKEIMVEPYRIEAQKYVFCDNGCYKENIGKYFSGRNNHFYNHNLTDEERLSTRKYREYYSWRRSVYERDGFMCVCCGDGKGGNLEAHHILNYSEHEDLRVNIDNGITLCTRCHMGFHKVYGYRNNNRKQLNEFMQRTLLPQ